MRIPSKAQTSIILAKAERAWATLNTKHKLNTGGFPGKCSVLEITLFTALQQIFMLFSPTVFPLKRVTDAANKFWCMFYLLDDP